VTAPRDPPICAATMHALHNIRWAEVVKHTPWHERPPDDPLRVRVTIVNKDFPNIANIGVDVSLGAGQVR